MMGDLGESRRKCSVDLSSENNDSSIIMKLQQIDRSLGLDMSNSGISTVEEEKSFKYEEVFPFQLIESEQQIVDNKQGHFQLLEKRQNAPILKEDHPSEFRALIKQLENGDFSSMAMFWGDRVKQTLRFITKNWRLFTPEFTESLQNFLNVCHLHCENSALVQLKEANFEDLQRFKRIISNKLTYEGRKQNLALRQQHKNNFFLPQFISELKVKCRKEGSYFVKERNEKKAMADFIAENQYFKNNLEMWKKIFFEATCLIRYNKVNTPHNDIKEQIDNVYRFAELSLKNCELSQPCNKLCCSKFMYLAFDICPLQNLNLLIRPKLSYLKQFVKTTSRNRPRPVQNPNEDRNELKEVMLDVCGLLNGGGGVILFNVKQEYLEVRPYGESLIVTEMNEYRDVIKEGIKSIYPKVELDRQIRVNFVPLVKHPYEYGYSQHVVEDDDKKINRNYITGLYVMRISVFPSKSSQIYCYSIGRDNVKSAVLKNGVRETLSKREIVEEMRRKFQFFHVEAQSEEEAALLAKDYTYVQKNHKCELPYEGSKLVRRSQDIAQNTPENRFSRVSLIVVPPKYYGTITETLKQKGIDIFISNRFSKYNFKSTSNSAPVYHNVRFDQLLSQIAYKSEFQFEGRHVLLIKVTKYLKFSERKKQNVFPPGDFASLTRWLHRQFPLQKMKYLTYTKKGENDGIVDHYLKMESSQSVATAATVWMYCVLHQFGEKMLFKDPIKNDQMEEKQVYNSQLVQFLDRPDS